MTNKRWNALMEEENTELTQEEIAQGWHFCPEWDLLLVGPGMKELEACRCEPVVKKDKQQ